MAFKIHLYTEDDRRWTPDETYKTRKEADDALEEIVFGEQTYIDGSPVDSGEVSED